MVDWLHQVESGLWLVHESQGNDWIIHAFENNTNKHGTMHVMAADNINKQQKKKATVIYKKC
jgi:hypothetical protein